MREDEQAVNIKGQVADKKEIMDANPLGYICTDTIVSSQEDEADSSGLRQTLTSYSYYYKYMLSHTHKHTVTPTWVKSSTNINSIE